MKVVHFKRREESGMHMHWFSDASHFYIPDENVVLSRNQQGTFGGLQYQIIEGSFLDEAMSIAAGVVPDIENVSFSEIQEFEYDDMQLKALVTAAKNHEALEETVQAGFDGLFSTIEPPRPDPVDPESLSVEERTRLEGLIKTYVHNALGESEALFSINSPTALEANRAEHAARLRQELGFVEAGTQIMDSGIAYLHVLEAQQLSLDDIAKGFAQVVYNGFHGQSEDYRRALKAADILEASKEPIYKKRFIELVNDESGSMSEMEEVGSHLSDSFIQEVVEPVYNHLIGNVEVDEEYIASLVDPDDYGDDMFEEALDYERRNYTDRSVEQHLKATQIAKLYMDENTFHEAGKKLVQVASDEVQAEMYDTVGMQIMELDLPRETVRPFMLELFGETLDYMPHSAHEISQKYGFSDEEIREPLNATYNTAIENGRFDLALGLHNLYGSLIQNNSFSVGDLTTLAGVREFQYKR